MTSPASPQAISESIVTPRINAQMMIDGHPYLTRLNTFISPEEMTKDPFFFESRDLRKCLERAHGDPPDDVRRRGVHGLQRPATDRAVGRPHVLGAGGLESGDLRRDDAQREGTGQPPGGRGRVPARGDGPGHARPRQHGGDRRRDRGEQRHVPGRTDAVPDTDGDGWLDRRRRRRRRESRVGRRRRRRLGNGKQVPERAARRASPWEAAAGPVASPRRQTTPASATAAAAAVRPAAPGPAPARSSSRSPDCSADCSGAAPAAGSAADARLPAIAAFG